MQGEIDGVTYEIPQHVAVIMDGNGRWAKKRLLPNGLCFFHRELEAFRGRGDGDHEYPPKLPEDGGRTL